MRTVKQVANVSGVSVRALHPGMALFMAQAMACHARTVLRGIAQ